MARYFVARRKTGTRGLDYLTVQAAWSHTMTEGNQFNQDKARELAHRWKSIDPSWRYFVFEVPARLNKSAAQARLRRIAAEGLEIDGVKYEVHPSFLAKALEGGDD